MVAPLRKRLTTQELEFLYEYELSRNLSGSYKKCFPDNLHWKKSGKPKTDQKIYEAAKELLTKPHIKAYLQFKNLPSKEKSLQIVDEQMLHGEPKAAFDAAKLNIQIADKRASADASRRWVELANSIGAKVIIPPHSDPLELDFESFLTGEVHLELPLAQSSGS